MGRTVGLVVGGVFLLWFVGNLLLGPNTSGVELSSTPVAGVDMAPQPGELPKCVGAHTYSARGWSGHDLIRSDVWLTGCNNPAGQLRIKSGPTCAAKSFLGPGVAYCSASPSGSRLRVTVTFHYPAGLDSISGQPATSTFFIDPSGGYSSF